MWYIWTGVAEPGSVSQKSYLTDYPRCAEETRASAMRGGVVSCAPSCFRIMTPPRSTKPSIPQRIFGIGSCRYASLCWACHDWSRRAELSSQRRDSPNTVAKIPRNVVFWGGGVEKRCVAAGRLKKSIAMLTIKYKPGLSASLPSLLLDAINSAYTFIYNAR